MPKQFSVKSQDGCHNCRYVYLHRHVEGGVNWFCHYDLSFIPEERLCIPVEDYVYDDVLLSEYPITGLEWDFLQENVYSLMFSARHLWEEDHEVSPWCICDNWKGKLK